MRDPYVPTSRLPSHPTPPTDHLQVRKTSYRRRRQGEDEFRSAKEASREQEEAVKVLTPENKPNSEAPRNKPPILLLDAYNLMNVAPELKRLLQIDLGFARAVGA